MKKREEQKAINRLHKLTSVGDAKHRGYTYFMTGNPRNGYRWELANAAGDTVCKSETFSGKRDGLKMLRAAQRHAATTYFADHCVE